MDVGALQKKLMLMLAVVGVSTLACAAALFAGIRYHNNALTVVGVAALVVGFGVQIWFISAVARKPHGGPQG
jgi:hypothetical protein